MKPNTFSVAIVLFVLSLLVSVTSMAEIRPGGFELTPLVGGYVFEANQDLENGLAAGLGFGYHITKHWGVEGIFNYIDTKFDSTGEDVDGYLYHLDGLYHFRPDKRLVPYLSAGVGGITLAPDKGSSSTDPLLNGGGGLKYFLTDFIALRGDVRYILAFGSTQNNLAFTFGVTFNFGGKEKEVVPAALPPPVDSDGDGVYDHEDQCPNTPAGAPVDAVGCPLDSDNDGVYDHEDQCPDTPAGAKVDESGCPIVLKEEVSVELNVEFDLNKADIKPDYHDELSEVADFMKAYPLTAVVIEGHTDGSGSAQYNLQLSQRRAESIRQYLIDEFGIAPERLSAKGYGESKPIASNETREGRQRNRRVVAVISATKETPQMRE